MENKLIEMTVFTNKIDDTTEVIKILREDGIEVTYHGLRVVDAMCSEEYADQFTDKMYNQGIELHALGY